MYAGVDCGSSLLKVVYETTHGTVFYSNIHDRDGWSHVKRQMSAAGVTSVCKVGLAQHRYDFSEFNEIRLSGEKIPLEIAAQACGARELIFEEDGDSPAPFLLVGIGTGTSYAIVDEGGRTKRFPLGSAIGGGTIAGLAELTGIGVGTNLDKLAEKGVPLDLLVRDIDPSMASHPEGGLVVSHFDLGRLLTAKEEIAATIFQMVAVTIVRDIMLMGGFRSAARSVVYAGTPIAMYYSLQRAIKKWHSHLDIPPYFLPRAGYATALGAMHLGRINKTP